MPPAVPARPAAPAPPAVPAHPLARTDLPFRGLALIWVIAGGLVAAVTGPLALEHGSWTAAFAVLVGGVLQAALGFAQHTLAAPPPRRRMLGAELVTWNLGCLAVIAGTWTTLPPIVDVGGVLLVATLALMIAAVGRGSAGPTWAVWLFRAALAMTLVSIPIGLVLAQVRAG